MKKIAVCLLMLVACAICRAVMIGPFPGLTGLVEESDAIVILGVEEYLDKFPQSDGWGKYRCCIYQALKGDFQPGSRIEVTLLDTRSSFITPFGPGSTHLMFLTKKRSPFEETAYHTIERQGANIRLSPFGNEKTPPGKSIQERIQFLIRKAIEYWDEQQKKEREFLEQMLKP